jgi:hypothetical protein
MKRNREDDQLRTNLTLNLTKNNDHIMDECVKKEKIIKYEHQVGMIIVVSRFVRFRMSLYFL